MTESNPCIFGPLLGALHDGELPDDRRRDVLEHVRTCPACAAELADIRRFGGVLSAVALPSLTEARLDQVFEQSRRIAGASPAPIRAAEPAHLRYVRWISGIAAAVFVLAIGQVVYQRMIPPETDPSLRPANFESPVTTNPTTPEDHGPESRRQQR